MPLIYKDFIQNVRLDSGSTWESRNPVVNKNEVAFNYDTLQYKIGDGEKTYKQLPFCTKYYSDYTEVFPILEGVPTESFKSTVNSGGFIRRGNLINLGFTIKVKLDMAELNPTDDINITLQGAPKIYQEMVFNDIMIYGVRPIDKVCAQPIQGSNTIKIMAKYSREDTIGYQTDYILPLEAKEIIDDYLMIQGSFAYISSETSSDNIGIVSVDPYKENKFNNLFLYTENENVRAFQLYAKLYRDETNEESPVDSPIRIYTTEEIAEPEEGFISGNIVCKGINAHDIKLMYIGKEDDKYLFELVSVIGENVYQIYYSSIASYSMTISGTYVY